MNKSFQEPLQNYSISSLKGVGNILENRLNKLGIFTVFDLLFHFPLRYEDRSKIELIQNLSHKNYATIQANIINFHFDFKRKKQFICQARDESASIILRFLNFNPHFTKVFEKGKIIRAFGEVRRGKHSFEMIHPKYEIFDKIPPNQPEKLTPIYPTTEGLNQKIFLSLMTQALDLLNKYPLNELFPPNLQIEPIEINKAIWQIHQSNQTEQIQLLNQRKHPAQKKIITEELLAHHLSLKILHKKNAQENGIALKKTDKIQQFIKSLPFKLTKAQKRSFSEIEQDLSKNSPMMRLLQGDVGSGKTLIAALSALITLENNYQIALLAPTEILAEQLKTNFEHWFSPFSYSIAFLAGKQRIKEKREILEKIKSGENQIVIGTHAIFQENVEFNRLALIIIDEQHRFGVQQRLALRQKGISDIVPHQLLMSATPIPRTLAMTMYADLDISIIDELPPGRKPIKTVIIPNSRRDEIIERIRINCENRCQVYWVCTLIDESETVNVQAANNLFNELLQKLPSIKIGLIHGKLKPEEKQEIMKKFKNHEMELLIATTVIEVGVDVPNASLMIIENSERLGLSQLHQLRGRIGRGAIESFCILLYHLPLGKTAQKRLQIMRQSQNGFEIAEKDLQIRGSGEILGTKQSGEIVFKIADLEKDFELLPRIYQLTKNIDQFPAQFEQNIIERWLTNKHLFLTS